MGTDVDSPDLPSGTCLNVVINKAMWLSLRLKTVTELFYNFCLKSCNVTKLLLPAKGFLK